MLVQVHDELVFEVEEKEYYTIKKLNIKNGESIHGYYRFS